MMIFHSYVSLPEGNGKLWKHYLQIEAEMWEVPEVNGGFVRWELDVHQRKWGIFTKLGDEKGKKIHMTEIIWK